LFCNILFFVLIIYFFLKKKKKKKLDDKRRSAGLNTNLINKDIEAIDFKQNTVCDDDDDDEKEECDFNVDAIDTMNAEKIVESGYLYIRSTKLKVIIKN